MSGSVHVDRLEKQFGPISDDITWFGVHEHGIKKGLKPLPHIINRAGIFTEMLTPAASIAAAAYVMARMTHGLSDGTADWVMGGDNTTIGVVSVMSELHDAEKFIGRPLETGLVPAEEGVVKANFVSPLGLCATIRQTMRGASGPFIFNGSGMAELSVQELLPEAKAIVQSCVAAANVQVSV